jgi:hypothetical protein
MGLFSSKTLQPMLLNLPFIIDTDAQVPRLLISSLSGSFC